MAYRIMARVIARNERKDAVVETNEPNGPFRIVTPAYPASNVPDQFSARFDRAEEDVLPLGSRVPVRVAVLGAFPTKRHALSYLR